MAVKSAMQISLTAVTVAEISMRFHFQSITVELFCVDSFIHLARITFRHAKICKKVFASKRKPFNSAKQRIQGTDLEQFIKVSQRKGNGKQSFQPQQSIPRPQLQTIQQGRTSSNSGYTSKTSSSAMPKWKADSLAFRNAMRNAKMVSRAEQQSKATGIPLHKLLPAASSKRSSYDEVDSNGQGGYGSSYVDPSFIQCPHCFRHYSQKAGERHIPQVYFPLLYF